MKCEYGCDKDYKFILRNGKRCCSRYASSCEVLRRENSQRIKELHNRGILTSIKPENRKLPDKNKPFETLGKKGRRNIVLFDQKYKCYECGIKDWNNKTLSFQIDHIDGNRSNNNRENLRGLCPNCHSQTPTYCGKNINKGNIKISDDDILNSIRKSNNINYSLNSLGLSSTTTNYKRAYQLLINQLRNEEIIDLRKSKRSAKEYQEEKKKKNNEKNKPIIDLIKKSGIEFDKFGWVNEASKIIGIVPQKVNNWIKRNMLDFYEKNCYKRK